MKNELLRQHHLGVWIGSAKDLFSRTTFYLSFINFGLLAVTAYNTTLRYFLPSVSFPVFLGALSLIWLAAMLLEYKYVLPSSMTFLNHQMWAHNSPVKQSLERIEKRLARLEEALHGDHNGSNLPDMSRETTVKK